MIYPLVLNSQISETKVIVWRLSWLFTFEIFKRESLQILSPLLGNVRITAPPPQLSAAAPTRMTWGPEPARSQHYLLADEKTSGHCAGTSGITCFFELSHTLFPVPSLRRHADHVARQGEGDLAFPFCVWAGLAVHS